MTDHDLVLKKLAFIETALSELRTLANPSAILTDLREERFVEHTLQIAIQAALDVAAHIVSDDRLGEPQSNQQLFDLLVRAGWISIGQSTALRQMTGFRNVLVHGYATVNPATVKNVVEHHLGDLEGFVDAIRQRLGLP